MIKELQMCQDSYPEMLEMYLRQIFIKLQRHFKFSVNTVNSHAAEEIDKAISYFSEHYNEPISIDDYAEQNHVSASWFIRNFRLYAGITPKQFILQKEYIMPKHCFKIHNIISMRSHKLLVMIIHYISAGFFKRQKGCHLLNIVKTYKKMQKAEDWNLCFCNFCPFIFLFWQVIYPFVFYNDSVNRKEMNFHEKQIPQLY